MINPCNVPTHYRLGRLLSGLPEARRALLDLRRKYGGQLIPSFWSVGQPNAVLAGRGAEEATWRPADLAPLPRAWCPKDQRFSEPHLAAWRA
jgi:hypothetical protein